MNEIVKKNDKAGGRPFVIFPSVVLSSCTVISLSIGTDRHLQTV